MLRLLPMLAASFVLCGCFVFEELEAGEKLMEQNSPRAAAKAEEAAKAATDGGAPAKPAGAAWWSEARSLGRVPEAAPDDPNAPVSCRIQGAVRFMRRADCHSQGGREA